MSFPNSISHFLLFQEFFIGKIPFTIVIWLFSYFYKYVYNLPWYYKRQITFISFIGLLSFDKYVCVSQCPGELEFEANQ